MPYRDGDPTVTIEAAIEVTTARAYLIKPTMGSKREVWCPKSQVVSITEGGEGEPREFVVTQWWYNKAELDILDEE